MVRTIYVKRSMGIINTDNNHQILQSGSPAVLTKISGGIRSSAFVLDTSFLLILFSRVFSVLGFRQIFHVILTSRQNALRGHFCLRSLLTYIFDLMSVSPQLPCEAPRGVYALV